MKFTTKQLNGYYMAKRKYISANDNYNKDVFGITQAEYKVIRQAEQGEYGICQGANRLSLNKLNNSYYVKGY